MHVITTIRKVSRYQRGDRNSKDRQFNGQTKKKNDKKTHVDKILHRKLTIEQHELHYRTEVNL